MGKKITCYYDAVKHFGALLALLPIFFWFEFLEAYLLPKYTVEIPLDRFVPFLPIFVVPYLLWFVYVGFGIIFVGITAKQDFNKQIFYLACGMSTAYLIYMLLPNQQALRPFITQTDIFSQLIKQIYLTDTPTNVCPSVHVINTFVITASLLHTKTFLSSRPLKISACTLAVLICLSTVFIKQHSVLDVAIGLVVGVVFYIPIYRSNYIVASWRKAFQR